MSSHREISSNRRIWEWAAVAAVVLLYLFLALRQWKAPGFVCDWLYSEQTALDIMARLDRGMSPLAVFLEGNRRVDPYHGTLTGTLLAPLFILFGPSWFLARLYPVAFGALTLVLTYRFCRELFGFAVAILAVFLLSIHNPFLLGTKLGDWFVNHAQAFSMGSLLLLSLWRSGNKPAYLAAGMAVMGLGFGTRMWYVWFPAALLALGTLYSIGVLRRREEIRPRASTLKSVLIGGAGLYAGYWLGSRDPSASSSNNYLYQAVLGCFSRDNSSGFFHYPENISRTLQLFNSMLSGEFFQTLLAAKDYPFLNPVVSTIFWGILPLSALVLLSRKAEDRGKWGFVAALFLLMLCISPLNTSGKEIHVEPLFFLYPFPQILLAAGFILAWKNGASRFLRASIALLMALLIGAEIRSVMVADAYLRETGGRRHYSGTIYDLADWVKGQRALGREFLLFYFNLSEHLHLITSDPYFRLPAPGTRQTNHIFFSYDFAGQTGEKCWIIQNGDPMWLSDTCALVLPRIEREVFVIESVFTDMPNRFGIFAEQAARFGMETTKVKQFADDTGTAVFNVYLLNKLPVPATRQKSP